MTSNHNTSYIYTYHDNNYYPLYHYLSLVFKEIPYHPTLPSFSSLPRSPPLVQLASYVPRCLVGCWWSPLFPPRNYAWNEGFSQEILPDWNMMRVIFQLYQGKPLRKLLSVWGFLKLFQAATGFFQLRGPRKTNSNRGYKCWDNDGGFTNFE